MPADIRVARMTDVDALLGIEDAAFNGDRITRRSFRHLVASPTAAVLVAEENRRLTGYAVVLFRHGQTVARLYSLAIAPGEGGRGHGRRLLEAAERAAGQRRAQALRLEVRADNDRARALYERGGYHRIGALHSYYFDGATADRYEKPLRPGRRTPPAGGDHSGEASTP